jgi:hypothetical protein
MMQRSETLSKNCEINWNVTESMDRQRLKMLPVIRTGKVTSYVLHVQVSALSEFQMIEEVNFEKASSQCPKKIATNKCFLSAESWKGSRIQQAMMAKNKPENH